MRRSTESFASQLRDECCVLSNAIAALHTMLGHLASGRDLKHRGLHTFRSRLKNIVIYTEFVQTFTHFVSGKYSVPNTEKEALVTDKLLLKFDKLENESESESKWRILSSAVVSALMERSSPQWFSAGSLSKIGWTQLVNNASNPELKSVKDSLIFHCTQTIPCANEMFRGIMELVNELFTELLKNTEEDSESSYRKDKTIHGVIGQWLADHIHTNVDRIALWCYHVSDWKSMHVLSRTFGIYMELTTVGSLEFLLSEIKGGRGNHVVDLMRALDLHSNSVLMNPYVLLTLLQVSAENDSRTVFYSVMEWYVDMIADGELPNSLCSGMVPKESESGSDEEEEEEEEDENEEKESSDESDDDDGVLVNTRDMIRRDEDELWQIIIKVWTFMLSPDMVGRTLPLLQQFNLDDPDYVDAVAFRSRLPTFASERLVAIGSIRNDLAKYVASDSHKEFHTTLEKYMHATQSKEEFGPVTVHGAPCPSLMVTLTLQSKHSLTMNAIWSFIQHHSDCMVLLKEHGFPTSHVPEFVRPSFQEAALSEKKEITPGEYFQITCAFDSGARPNQKIMGMPGHKKGPHGGKPMSRKFGIVMNEFREGRLKAGRGNRPNLNPHSKHDTRIAIAIADTIERKQEAEARKRLENKKN